MRSKSSPILLKILLKILSFVTFLLPYIYVLRFPILTWVLLVFLPYFAFNTGVSAIVANLFDVTPKGMFAFSLAAFTLSWTIMLTATLILIYSDARFGFVSARKIDKYKLFRWRWALPFFCLSAVPMIWAAFRISGPFTLERLFYTVLGLLVSLILLLLAYIAQLWLVNPKVLKDSPTLVNPYVREKLGLPESIYDQEPTQTKTGRKPSDKGKQPPKSEGNILERFFAYVATSNPFKNSSERLKNLFRDVPPKFGAGYFKYDQRDRVESVLPNHGFAIFSLILSLVLYFIIGFAKSFYFGAAQNPSVPTLAYVLLVLVMICWGLSGLSFFFDRYRIPVMLLFAVWILITSLIPFGSSDHFYQVRTPPQGVISLTPAEVVSNRKSPAIVVVAANGGGIQASAWAARVLVGLVKQCRKEFGIEFKTNCQEFAKAIYLISSASGGSVGSMYFVDAYSENGLPVDNDELEKVVEKAKRSSLDEVAWGLVYPDFQRALFPFITQTSDRGLSLEEALAAGTDLSRKNLTDWREGVRAGWRPATVFNATITETGEPFLLGTTDIKAAGFTAKNFGDYYPGKDISVVTAARLSASFPYVSPVARADGDGPSNNRLHVADGGYYDNYGMSTLTQWLDQALHAKENQIKHVLVIQIRGAPSAQSRSRDLGGNQSWFFQTYAPLSTIVGVRDGGQISHNNIEFGLLGRTLTGELQVAPESAVFEYQPQDDKPLPLSWRLTKEQQDAIDKNWEIQLTRKDWETVRNFIKNYLLPVQGQ